MENINDNGYESGAMLMNNTIREMRKHVEFEKFVCRMLIDNDDTREMKINTDNHPDSVHKFLYNNDRIEQHTMRGKHEAIGKSAYIPPTPVDEIVEKETKNVSDDDLTYTRTETDNTPIGAN